MWKLLEIRFEPPSDRIAKPKMITALKPSKLSAIATISNAPNIKWNLILIVVLCSISGIRILVVVNMHISVIMIVNIQEADKENLAMDTGSIIASTPSISSDNTAMEAALVRPIFFNYADMNKGTSGCTHVSAAFGFEGTTAFAVRYPESAPSPSDDTE